MSFHIKALSTTVTIIQAQLGSIHTCNLLSLNYSLKNGLYCTKRAHSHLLFCQLLQGLKSSIIGCVPIFLIVWTEKFMQ